MFKNMDFQKQAQLFKQTLGLEYEPLAISFTNDKYKNR